MKYHQLFLIIFVLVLSFSQAKQLKRDPTKVLTKDTKFTNALQSKMTQDDHEGIYELFQALDQNGDGQIEAHEAYDALIQMGENVSEEEIEFYLQSHDYDGSQSLDFQEFADLIQSFVEYHNKVGYALFDYISRQTVGVEDLVDFVKDEFGEDLQEDEVHALHIFFNEELDQDQDGYVTQGEIFDYYFPEDDEYDCYSEDYSYDDYDEDYYSEDQYSEDQYSEDQYSEDQYSEDQYSEDQYSSEDSSVEYDDNCVEEQDAYDEIEESWNSLNVDGNDEISVEDLSQYMGLGAYDDLGSDEQQYIDNTLSMYDFNGDGVVDHDDYVEYQLTYYYPCIIPGSGSSESSVGSNDEGEDSENEGEDSENEGEDSGNEGEDSENEGEDSGNEGEDSENEGENDENENNGPGAGEQERPRD